MCLMVYAESLDDLTATVQRGRQPKRWSRVKKEALVRGDLVSLKAFSCSKD
jgi:predicted GIY-YIG superfamily endonuclease